MISSAVRGTAVAALTTALALLPAGTAQAEQSDQDNNIEKLALLGVTVVDTTPHFLGAGESWVTHQKLYWEKKGDTAQYAGDSESECSAVDASHEEATTQCTRVLRLEKGTLTLSDMITRKHDKPVTAKTAIIGGTGHYRSAYGDGYITLDGDHIHWKLNVDE